MADQVFITNERLPFEAIENVKVISAEPLEVKGGVNVNRIYQRYEYKVFKNLNDFGVGDANQVAERLKQFLDDGWEIHFSGAFAFSSPLLVIRRYIWD